MLVQNPTGQDIQNGLKAALDEWRKENPSPKLQNPPEPELPEPLCIPTEKGLIVFEVIDGHCAALHVTDNSSARRIELSDVQVRKLVHGLLEMRKPMKEHSAWMHACKGAMRDFEFEHAAWRQRLHDAKKRLKAAFGITGGAE